MIVIGICLSVHAAVQYNLAVITVSSICNLILTETSIGNYLRFAIIVWMQLRYT
jgi:hypothetical protein